MGNFQTKHLSNFQANVVMLMIYEDMKAPEFVPRSIEYINMKYIILMFTLNDSSINNKSIFPVKFLF